MLRRSDSLSPADTLIEDPLIEPFIITKSSTGGYAVHERLAKGKGAKNYLKTHGYPSTFGNALRMVSKHLLDQSNNRHFTSIKEYIETFDQLQQKMKTITAID